METLAALPPITAHASGKLTDQFRVRLASWLADRNADWLDSFTDWHTGEHPSSLTDLMNPWQASGHIVKWGVATGRIAPDLGPKSMAPNRRDGLAAAIYFRSDEDRMALIGEMNAYVRRVADEKREKVYRAHPELRPEEYADPEWADVVPDDFLTDPE